jgi:hypothetical protein
MLKDVDIKALLSSLSVTEKISVFLASKEQEHSRRRSIGQQQACNTRQYTMPPRLSAYTRMVQHWISRSDTSVMQSLYRRL